MWREREGESGGESASKCRDNLKARCNTSLISGCAKAASVLMRLKPLTVAQQLNTPRSEAGPGTAYVPQRI